MLELLETKRRITQFFPELISKIRFINLLENLKVDKNKIENYRKELYAFAWEMKNIENLKLFQLHQKLFEESFSLNFIKEVPENIILTALLRLILAEDIDNHLLEVAFALKRFSKDWKKLVKEKILFSNEEEVDFKELSEIDREEIWDLEKRVEALKIILPNLVWEEEVQKFDTLLISEERVVEDLKEEVSIEKAFSLSKEVKLFLFNDPINKWLGLPVGERYPIFRQVLLVDSAIETLPKDA